MHVRRKPSESVPLEIVQVQYRVGLTRLVISAKTAKMDEMEKMGETEESDETEGMAKMARPEGIVLMDDMVVMEKTGLQDNVLLCCRIPVQSPVFQRQMRRKNIPLSAKH